MTVDYVVYEARPVLFTLTCNSLDIVERIQGNFVTIPVLLRISILICGVVNNIDPTIVSIVT